SSAAAPQPRHVLLLHSFEREFAPYNVIEETFRTELSRQSSEPIDFWEISLQPGRFNRRPADELILDYLHSAFEDHQPDLIVPIGGPAALFAQRNRRRLFPNAPMLLAGMDERFVHPDTLTPNDTVVPVANDGSLIVEDILRVLPRTTSVFLVLGTSRLERRWREELGQQLQRFNDRLRFAWSNELPFAELLKQSASLPPNSAIFYVLLSRDIQGVPLTEERALAQLHAVANAPIFGALNTQLGRGIVGGPLLDIDEVSRNATA